MALTEEKRSRKPTAKGLEYLLAINKEEFNRISKALKKIMNAQQQLGEHISDNLFVAMTKDMKQLKQCFYKLSEYGLDRDELQNFHDQMLNIEQQLEQQFASDQDKVSIITSNRGRKSPSNVSRTSSVDSERAKAVMELAKINEEVKYREMMKQVEASLVNAQQNYEEAKIFIEQRKSQAACNALDKLKEEKDEKRSLTPTSLASEELETKAGLLDSYLEATVVQSSSSTQYSSLPDLRVKRQQTSVRPKDLAFTEQKTTTLEQVPFKQSSLFENKQHEREASTKNEFDNFGYHKDKAGVSNVYSQNENDFINMSLGATGHIPTFSAKLPSKKNYDLPKPRPRNVNEPNDLPRSVDNIYTLPSGHPNYKPDVPSSFNTVPDNSIPIQTCNNNLENILGRFADMQLSNFSKVVDLLSSSQKKASLPIKEPEVFSGDLLVYPMWKASFTTLIDKRTEDAADKLYYLSRYTSGDAKSAIINLISLDTPEAYDDAMRILNTRYGNKFNIANAFRDKLEKWPKINLNDGSALMKFYDFLEQCKTAMGHIHYLKYLDDNKENRLMLQKLPPTIAERWNTIATKRTSKPDGEYPSFKEFCKFIGEEAMKANNPTSSYQAIYGKQKECVTEKQQKQSNRKTIKSTSFATKQNEVRSDAKNNKVDTTNASECSYCNNKHDIEVCKGFISLTLQKRQEFCKQNKLCSGCLRKGHSWYNCWYPKRCKTCNRLHPTLLHDHKLSEKHKVNSSQGDKDKIANKIVHRYTSEINSMIVPVKIINSQNEKSVNVYALLDDQSDACFIEEKLLETIDALGDDTVINIATMLGQQKIKCRKVSNLKVEGLQTGRIVDLPCVYSREVIPAKRNKIPTRSSALKWPHFEPIVDKLMELDKDMPISLLIGANCIEGIKPNKIITGSHNEPYALHTALGWGIIGNVNKECIDNEDLIVNRIICEQVTVGNEVTTNQFSVKESTKEILPNQILKVLQQDFMAGVHDEETGLSVEDQRFLDIMKNNLQFKNGQYVIPLPIKNESLVIPNNLFLAKKRLLNLKAKMLKNPQFKEDYCSFMKDIIESNFAEKVSESEINNYKSVWFIPHHGVYHPRKNKIRVVFDCSAKFKDFCLNENLLQGPDLTNNLVGILCRFRLNPIAFCCDIKCMFHQVIVREEHRDLLRFLWFENNDVNGPIIQYKMRVHVFGARSSLQLSILP